jgi:hypothetical protein
MYFIIAQKMSTDAVIMAFYLYNYYLFKYGSFNDVSYNSR